MVLKFSEGRQWEGNKIEKLETVSLLMEKCYKFIRYFEILMHQFVLHENRLL